LPFLPRHVTIVTPFFIARARWRKFPRGGSQSPRKSFGKRCRLPLLSLHRFSLFRGAFVFTPRIFRLPGNVFDAAAPPLCPLIPRPALWQANPLHFKGIRPRDCSSWREGWDGRSSRSANTTWRCNTPQPVREGSVFCFGKILPILSGSIRSDVVGV